jgi:hypothetical protein
MEGWRAGDFVWRRMMGVDDVAPTESIAATCRQVCDSRSAGSPLCRATDEGISAAAGEEPLSRITLGSLGRDGYGSDRRDRLSLPAVAPPADARAEWMGAHRGDHRAGIRGPAVDGQFRHEFTVALLGRGELIPSADIRPGISPRMIRSCRRQT